ncbi:immunoglobulin-like domain-containing protein, partial [Listeria newyorkensis]
EPNAPVTIKNGTTTIGTGTVKADGTFEVTIAKQAANATITATVTKASNGKKATASTTVKQGIDYSLTANTYKMGDTKLTGTVGKNVSRVRLWINGKPVVQGVINADGTYEFPTAANFIKLVGDTVEVVAVDSNYVEVNRKTVTVTGTSTFDNALTVAKFNTGDTKITGTFGKDIKKVRLSINGKSVTQAATTAAGTFEIANVDKFITSPLDLVEIVGVDDQYN